MSLEINYNPIYNEVFPDVKAEIETRSKIYGSNTRGYMGTRFDWETTKQSWCVVYKVDTKNKTNKKPILGFNIDKREETFLGMYDQKYGVPRNPILEEVRISNQGSYGALQVADIRFRCFTLEQVDKFENDILKPGSDVEIKYGWSSGRVSSRAQTNKIHPKNIDPSIDTYRGITYNFNIAMENSLEWVITLKSVGEGFFLSGLSANASSKIVDANLTDAEHPKILSDSGIVLNYVRSLSEKIDFDIYNHTTSYVYSNDGSNAYPNTDENHFTSYVDSSTKDGSILRYARLPFLPIDSEKSKEQKKIDKPTTNSNVKVYDDIEIEIPLTEESSYQKSIYDTEKYQFHPYRLGDLPVIYIGLSDLLHFYNESIAGRSERFDMNKKRIYLSANYNAWRNTDGKQLDEEEQHKYFPYGIRSVSIYDPEMVSCSPNTILFNGGIDENDTYNSANYTVDPNNTNKSSYFDVRNGYYRIGESKSKNINGKTIVYDKPIKTQFQRIDNPKLCNLGEILINIDFVKSILSEVSSVNDIQEKSIFSLFKKIFDEIEYASAGLYKLTFIQENVENDIGEYMSWYNVIDMNFT